MLHRLPCPHPVVSYAAALITTLRNFSVSISHWLGLAIGCRRRGKYDDPQAVAFQREIGSCAGVENQFFMRPAARNRRALR